MGTRLILNARSLGFHRPQVLRWISKVTISQSHPGTGLAFVRSAGYATLSPLLGERDRGRFEAASSKRYKKKGRHQDKKKGGKPGGDSRQQNDDDDDDEEEEEEEEEWDVSIYADQMETVLQSLERTFGSLRSSGASASILDGVMVQAYDRKIPLRQVAQIVVRDARMLEVRCLDQTITKEIKKGIEVANLGLTPVLDTSGKLSIAIPKMTRESREQMKKVAVQEAESARNVIRRVRKKAMDKIKLESKEMSEQDTRPMYKDINDVMDKWIKKVDSAVDAKTKDIDRV